MIDKSGNLTKESVNQMLSDAKAGTDLASLETIKSLTSSDIDQNIIHLILHYMMNSDQEISEYFDIIPLLHSFFDHPKIINHKNKAGHTPLVMILLSDYFTNIQKWKPLEESQIHEQLPRIEYAQCLEYYVISLIQSGADISEVKKFTKAQELLTTLLTNNIFEMQLIQSLMLQVYMSVPTSEFNYYDEFVALDKMVCKNLTSENNELLEPIKHTISPWLHSPKIVKIHENIKYIRDLAFKARGSLAPQEEKFDAYKYAASLSDNEGMYTNIITCFFDDVTFVKCKMLRESGIRQYLFRDLKRAGANYFFKFHTWIAWINNFLCSEKPNKYVTGILLDILLLYSKKDIEQNRSTLLNLSKHLIKKYNNNQNAIEFLELYSHLCKMHIADPNAMRLLNVDIIEPIIFAAIENDNYTILENLLKGGANINVKNRRHKNVLYAALELTQCRSQEQITKMEDNVAKKVALLLKYKANLNIGFLENTSSPYIYCIERGAYKIAETIANCEYVEINRMIKTINGLFSTNLIEACKMGDVIGVEILLKSGANTLIKDGNGQTAFDFNITTEVRTKLLEYTPAEEKQLEIIPQAF